MSETFDAPARSEPGDDSVVMEWSPSGVVTTMWVAMSIVLGLLGLMLFGLLYSLVGQPSSEPAVTFDAPVVALVSVLVLVLHQVVHAAVSRLLGGAPALVVDVVQLIFPVLYFRIAGQGFTRREYVIYLLAPLALITAIGTGFLVFDPRGALLIIPLSLNLGMSMRDIWMAWVVWRYEEHLLVEASVDGFRLTRPRD